MERNERKDGLGFKTPDAGWQADAFDAADTATMLTARILAHRMGKAPEGWHPRSAARHAVALHVVSGKLHRLDERRCSEPMDEARAERRNASLMADAQEIAAFYGLKAYHQGDCRGCALYLIPESDIPDASRFMEGKRADAYIYPSDPPEGPPLAVLQDRWVQSNYNQGHAVCRLGR